MEHLLLVAQIVVLFSLSALAIYSIVVLMKLRELLGTIEIKLKDVSTKILPTLENMEVITSKLRLLVENFDEQMSTVKKSVDTLRGITENIAAFEKRIQSSIESPIMDVMDTIGGIVRGFTSILSRFTGGN